MPFDEWYDDETREAATTRVLQRRMTNPTDRNVLTVVAEEFNVPRQTLSDWVDEASPESAKPKRKPRPKFSQVVKTTKEARVESPEDDEAIDAPQPAAPPEPASEPEPDAQTGSVPQAEAVPQTEAASDPEADLQPDPQPEPEAEPEQDPWAASDPAAEPEPEPTPESQPGLQPEPASVPAPTPAPAAPADNRLTALEAEVAALRAGNRALVEALRILVD
jgi:transposase-like protein